MPLIAGVLGAQLLLSPSRGELGEFSAYLFMSAFGTVGAGWLLVRIGAASRMTIRARTLLGAATGTFVGLLNVWIVAQLMFVSTDHDLRLLIVLLIVSGLVTIGFMSWVVRDMTERLGVVTSAVRTMASGDYAVSVPSGNDEVAELGADVLQLANRLSEIGRQRLALENERRDMTIAISHDLRTPLASMRAMLESLDEGVVDDPPEVRRYHGALARDVERLSAMVDDLFELARLDAGGMKLDLQPAALHHLATDVAAAMQEQARRKNVAIDVDPVTIPVVAMLDVQRIERAITNLVKNGLEHSTPHGRVNVRVADGDGDVVLSVSDNGPGIAPADLPHIWKRFYRADPSRTRDGWQHGAGLGLAIVRGIVEAHGGSVEVVSREGAGATFTMRLPRAERATWPSSLPTITPHAR